MRLYKLIELLTNYITGKLHSYINESLQNHILNTKQCNNKNFFINKNSDWSIHRSVHWLILSHILTKIYSRPGRISLKKWPICLDNLQFYHQMKHLIITQGVKFLTTFFSKSLPQLSHYGGSYSRECFPEEYCDWLIHEFYRYWVYLDRWISQM